MMVVSTTAAAGPQVKFNTSSHALINQLGCSDFYSKFPASPTGGQTILDACCNNLATNNQIPPMVQMSWLVLIGSIFYLVSSLSYSTAIVLFNTAPIPQVTINNKDRLACYCERGGYWCDGWGWGSFW
jgi:hypothetical protein